MPGKADRVDMNALAVVAIVCGSAIIVAGAIMLSVEECDPEYPSGFGCQPIRPYRTEGIALMFFGLSILILGAYAGMFHMGEQDTDRGAPCPDCRRPMTWVDQYDRWFCEECEKYS